MAFATDKHRAAAALIALPLAALAAYFGTGMHPLWPLLWLAPLPVLLVAPRLRPSAAFGLAALAWFIGGLNIRRYLFNVLRSPSGPSPLLIAFLILAIPSCVFGLAVLLSRRFMLRGNAIGAALVFPAVWVSYEYLLAVASPHSTFGNIAYTQMNFLPILQLGAVTGVWGISFCVFLLPATLAALWNGSAAPRQRRMLAAGAGVLFVAVFAFGLLRLSTAAPAPSVRVGLIASDLPQNVLPQEPADRLLREYADRAATLAGRGARVIVLPEKLGVVIDPSTREVDACFQGVANRGNADIVVGLIRVAAKRLKFNEARTYTPSRNSVLVYDKQHMLPAFESKLEPGTAEAILRKPSGVWGVAICKDMDFPQLSRRYGAMGTGLLLVPAWDFGDDGWLHGRMAVMRGVESGFTIARAAKEGLLTVSDGRGRVVAERSSAAAPFATLLADAPVRHETTPYVLLGDWFAWLVLAGLALLIVRLVR